MYKYRCNTCVNTCVIHIFYTCNTAKLITHVLQAWHKWPCMCTDKLIVSSLLLYVPIAWKQWVLHTESLQFVYWNHNGRTDPIVLAESADMSGSALVLWPCVEYPTCAASMWSNHWFQAIGTYKYCNIVILLWFGITPRSHTTFSINDTQNTRPSNHS